MFVKFRSRVTRFATTARIAMPKFVQSRCSRPIFPSGQTLRDVTTPIIDRPVYKLNLSSRSRGSSSQRTSTSGYQYPPFHDVVTPLNLGIHAILAVFASFRAPPPPRKLYFSLTCREFLACCFVRFLHNPLPAIELAPTTRPTNGTKNSTVTSCCRHASYYYPLLSPRKRNRET